MQDEDKAKVRMCPVEKEAFEKPACMATVPNLAYCEVCGKAMCPVCHRHNGITQLSRVTGYVGAVNGWNEAKKQELKDGLGICCKAADDGRTMLRAKTGCTKSDMNERTNYGR